MSEFEFDVVRWVRRCLPRSAGNMVTRLCQIAIGVLAGRDLRYVTTDQVERLTGLSAELIEDVVREGIESGELCARDRGGVWPVQEVIALDSAAEARRELELAIACETCNAFIGDECVTSAGNSVWMSHFPRRAAADIADADADAEQAAAA